MTATAPSIPDGTVKTFLSCSIRPAYRPLVRALAFFLERRGFNCVTVGRNVSEPDEANDIIRNAIEDCDCLVGLAATRYIARDAAFRDRTLKLATPYLVQEAAMAFQSELPFLIVKTRDVTLEAVTMRNLHLEIEPQLTPQGVVKFDGNASLVQSSLADLKRRALDRQRKKKLAGIKDIAFWTSVVSLGGGSLYGLWQVVDRMRRPDCFGTFYFKKPECGNCQFKPKCRVEKAKRASEG